MKIDWKDYNELVEELVSAIEFYHERNLFTAIVGVSRGGLIPATVASYRTGIPLGAVFIRAYKAKETLDEKVIWDGKIYGINIDKTNIVFVDDIVDTGTTMKHLKTAYPNSMAMALVKNKRGGAYKPDWWATTATTWVDFPYDKEVD